MNIFKELGKKHKENPKALEFLKFIGPGILVTVGFIDPGNWATNIEAGSSYGYTLLWVVTLSTFMLILLQHNAAHLGIVTGKCLAESATCHLPRKASRPILITALIATISTAFAEIIGGAIALEILFDIPMKIGAIITFAFVTFFTFSNTYARIEKVIIAFVSIIGFSFIFEIITIDVEWGESFKHAFVPEIPKGALFSILGVIGAVVMPHNLFLHSEIIQSRQWNLKGKNVVEKQLKYEFFDTLFSMTIGWVINCAMIILAAVVFSNNNIQVSDIGQASDLLTPLLGKMSSIIFALAFLFAGISSSITCAMAGGIVFAGMFDEEYNIKDLHSKVGVLISLIPALIVIFFVNDAFQALVLSQVVLCFQLPFTVILQLVLTSSRKVMGDYANKGFSKILLWACAIFISILNIILLIDFIV